MLAIVLPALNEADRLDALLSQIKDAVEVLDEPFEIIVVDDGSVDETGRIAETRAVEMPVRLISHAVNRGYGAALKTGLLAAIEHADIIVTMDADDTHDPTLIPEMVRRLSAGTDLVVASRFASGGREVGVPLHRRVISHTSGWVGRIVFQAPNVRDYTSGFRAYRASLVRGLVAGDGPALPIETGFTAGLELLLVAARMGARIAEVPLVLRYDQKVSPTRFSVRQTLGPYLHLVARHAFRSASGKPRVGEAEPKRVFGSGR